MPKPLIIGITGGIGSGKSTLSNLLRKEGYPVYDTDYEARRLQDEDPELVTSIKLLLGDDCYQHSTLNRKAVAERVFNKPELLAQLSKLVHPVVQRSFFSWMCRQKSPIVYFESAVLFEGNFKWLVDKVIVVTASENIRIQRVMHRDGSTHEQVLARIANQWNETEKIIRADLVINTDNGMPADVIQQLKQLHSTE